MCVARSCHNFGNSLPMCVCVLWDEKEGVMLRLENVLIGHLSWKYEKAVWDQPLNEYWYCSQVHADAWLLNFDCLTVCFSSVFSVDKLEMMQSTLIIGSVLNVFKFTCVHYDGFFSQTWRVLGKHCRPVAIWLSASLQRHVMILMLGV